MNSIAPYAKAIVAAVVAGLGSLYQALDGDQSISAQEWIAVAMTTLTALGVVFAVPNKDPDAEHQDESVQPPNQRGRISPVVALLALIAVLVFIIAFDANLTAR